MKGVGALWLTFTATPAILLGQSTAATDFHPGSTTEKGVHLSGVSVYSGYYSSGSPSGFEVTTDSPFLQGPSAMAGVAATIGGSFVGEKSTFTWTYSPSYFNLFYANRETSNNGSFSHRVGGNWTRKLGNSNKWTLTGSVTGLIINLEQLYANPGVFSSVASMPTTFDALASGMLTGKFTDAQLASVLTGAPLQATPEQAYLYGNRMFNAAANVSIAWAPSGRTTVSLGMSGNRAQPLDGFGTLGGTMGSAGSAFLNQTTNAGAEILWSYSLSPRTQISVGASSTRTYSRLQQGYATSGNFSVGRTVSRRWFLQGRGGAGKLTNEVQMYQSSKAVQYLYGGSVGWKTYTHTFLLSYDRSLGDVYGLGSNTTSAATAAWAWRRPGSNWSISANGSYQKLNNMTFQNTRSWRVGAGVGRALAPHLFMSAQYIYLQVPIGLNVVGFNSSQNGVVISMSWSPSIYQ